MSTNDLLDAFARYLQYERKASLHTVQGYRSDLAHFLKFSRTVYGLDETSSILSKLPELLPHFFQSFFGRRQKSTLHRYQATLKKWIRFLKLTGQLSPHTDLALASIRVPPSFPDSLSQSQMKALLDAFSPPSAPNAPSKIPGKSPSSGKGLRWPYRNQAILELLYSSGLRASELTQLTLGTVWLNEGFLRCFGKRQKERLVPLTQSAQKALEEYLRRERPRLSQRHPTQDYVFLSQKGGALTRIQLWTLVRHEALRRNIPGEIHPHLFRHSFATHLLENDLDILWIQKLLGHQDVRTTQMYTRIQTRRLKERLKQLHPRSR